MIKSWYYIAMENAYIAIRVASLMLKYNFYTENMNEKSTLHFFSKKPRQQVFGPLFLRSFFIVSYYGLLLRGMHWS